MKQAFLQKGKVHLQEVDIPAFDKKSVLVKVEYSFISSGTELATLQASEKSLTEKFLANSKNNIEKVIGAVKENGLGGTIALVKSKRDNFASVGYSCSGKIIAVGQEVEKFKVGDYVACGGAGFANHAQVISVPQNLAVKISNDSFLKHASLTTIGAIAMQGIRRANLNLGEKVCVFGLGLIGQITVQLAKLSGCQVIGVDLAPERMQLAKELGADFVFNPIEVDLKNELDFLTSHYGVDATIITAASCCGIVIDQAMDVTRRKGRVVLVGDVKLDFSREAFYSKEIDFLISCSYGPGRYDKSYEIEGKDYPYSYVRWTENRNMQLFVDLLEDNKILIEPLISHEFELQNAQKAYDFLQKSKSLGIVLSYQDQEKYSLQDVVARLLKEDEWSNVKPYVVPEDKLRVGLVGVGGFAKIKLLPLLSKNKNSQIQCLIDTDVTNLLNTAKMYGARNIGSDYHRLFLDDEIDMVVVATPHSLHFEQTMAALTEGKAVFVEKPAAVNFEQLEKLENFLKKNNNILYCVDFNRSFAPFNLQIKKELQDRKNPMLIHYRMNAGFIPKDHWIQSLQNGGRIIGETCHIFELFCFLTDSEPVSVAVESANHGSDDLLSNDNVAVNLKMKDGSCCSLLYTALGNKNLQKERMEIFFDGKAIVMEDYKKLQGYGLPTSFNKIVNSADKGHKDLLYEFVQVAKGFKQNLPIPLQRIICATKISLIADELARNGGGYKFL